MVVGGETTQVRIAVSAQQDRTARFYSISTTGTQDLLWVIPTGRGAAIDMASNAWLEALDFVTAPRIASSCGGTKMEIAKTIDLGSRSPLTGIKVITDPSEI